LEGQTEFSVIKFSELDKIRGRVDAEFYQKKHLLLQGRLAKLGSMSLKDVGAKLDCSAFYPSITEQYNFEGIGIPFLRVNEIQNGLVKTTESTAFLPQHVLDRNPTTISTAMPFDIVIAKGGNSLAKLGLLPSDFPKYALSRDLIVMRTSHLKRNKYFVWLYLHSKFGQDVLWRTASQTGQPHLTLPSIDQLTVPLYSNQFETFAEILYKKSVQLNNDSVATYKSAETILHDALGLSKFSNDVGSVNILSMKNSFAETGRLDAEYYQPKFDALEKICIKNASYVKRIEEIQIYNSRGLQPEYFEDGELDVVNSRHILERDLDYKNFEKTNLKSWNIQSKAQIFRNDILIYTTGANIGRTQVYLSDKKALASNHVNILRLKNENVVYVAFVLNAKIGRLQTEQLSAGSAQQELYPKDIANFYVPFIDLKHQTKISALVQKSFSLNTESERLLEVAKLAVEIAIEKGEKAAMKYLSKEIGDV
jgi:type I restriction enzyme S subunit